MIPWRRDRLPTPVFWPGEFHGLCSPWGCKESDTSEQLSISLDSLSKVSINLGAEKRIKEPCKVLTQKSKNYNYPLQFIQSHLFLFCLSLVSLLVLEILSWFSFMILKLLEPVLVQSFFLKSL